MNLKSMKDLMYYGLTDEQLIAEFLNGDGKCSGILYIRYYTKVYSMCISFTRNHDDAFDMTQEILLKAIGSVSSFGGKSKFSTWLYSIANNYCISQSVKKSKTFYEDIKNAQYILEEGIDYEDIEERVRWEVLESNLDSFLTLLPEGERKMLVLKYLENYSVKDLQNEFNLSASAVKMRLMRARLKMSKIIGLQEAA